MTVDVKNRTSSPEDIQSVTRAAVADHGATKEDLVSILTEVNHKLGYLPPAAFTEIGRLLRVPVGQLFSVASFYQMFSTKPRGRHVVQFCESAPCHVIGGRQVWTALQDALGLKSGETSTDGKWTLQTTSCLGVCAVGPVIVVDEDVYGNVEPANVPEILAKYL